MQAGGHRFDPGTLHSKAPLSGIFGRLRFEPGENHWHGAAPSRFMTHMAIQQADAHGNIVTSGGHVTDGKYAEAPSLEGGR